ncbi:MAG: threonine/serine dehydratase [Myxococcota bacterium]|nr:threonine/serine dehydratase [Myxococcota bacterium]
MRDDLDLEAIRAAAERIAPYVVHTPTLRLDRPEAVLWCKAESLQPTGAFKLRGAFNKMLSLPAGTPGVVAHSSGNHAQAVARAARVLGLPAVVVMPEDAPQAKLERTRADGAEVVIVGPDSAEREARAAEIERERGLAPVLPFDDVQVAAGQGTAALELLDAAPPLDRFYAPVSGGGLMAGCATAVRALSPATEIVAVEPAGANRLELSLAADERIAVPPPRTLADGLRVRRLGAGNWEVLRESVSRVVLVDDDQLLDAMALAARELRLVLEPSGAASLAAALREAKGDCGVLLSGGNVDPAVMRHALGKDAAPTEGA